MNKWMVKTVLTVACLGLFAKTSQAQSPFKNFNAWYKKSTTQWNLDRKRNNALPQPFATRDQVIVQQSFASMYLQGATLSRILDSVHFDPKTQELNNVGKSRLREILEQKKPLDILVASTLDPEVDKQRREKIESLLAAYSFEGNAPGVKSTFYLPHYRAGSEQSDLRQRFLLSQPQPTLEAVSGGIAGSASGGQ